ncbi:MAG: 30S ribosome-binding factor RbfA [Clostridia bacterium]|nr:30S ribosome-binding factor RbfA [Clostridia bacterium]
MANYRRGRINDEMQKTLAEILREVKDPRVSDAFISVTGVEVTPDLKYAKVFYSAMRGDKKEVRQGLKSSAGFIRRQVAQRMNLRATPEFTFIEDESIAYGARISTLLNSITITTEEESEGDGEEN